jgi:hypothetical protein
MDLSRPNPLANPYGQLDYSLRADGFPDPSYIEWLKENGLHDQARRAASFLRIYGLEDEDDDDHDDLFDDFDYFFGDDDDDLFGYDDDDREPARLPEGALSLVRDLSGPSGEPASPQGVPAGKPRRWAEGRISLVQPNPLLAGLHRPQEAPAPRMWLDLGSRAFRPEDLSQEEWDFLDEFLTCPQEMEPVDGIEWGGVEFDGNYVNWLEDNDLLDWLDRVSDYLFELEDFGEIEDCDMDFCEGEGGDGEREHGDDDDAVAEGLFRLVRPPRRSKAPWAGLHDE